MIVGISLYFSVFLYDGQPHFSLFLGAAAAGLLGYFLGFSWKEISNGLINSINKGISALIIMLIIGMLIGVWIGSGMVPALIYIGFDLLLPAWFLPIVLILSCVTSVITGSSWTTIGTIGVTAISVGYGLGISEPIIAGVVVSGAFFGDKLSPMSDSTNLTSSLLDVELFTHIKHMLYTTVPSFLIALLFYTLLGLFSVKEADIGIEVIKYQEVIKNHFNLSPLLAIPPLVVIVMVIYKVPAIPSLTAGLILGGLTQIFIQGQTLEKFYQTVYNGFMIETEIPEINELLSGGGLSSMYNVVAIGILALAFGGIMETTGMLKAIVNTFLKFTYRIGSLITVTLLTSVFLNIFGGNQYMSVIIPGEMYRESYREKNLQLKNLTRTLEGGGTLTSPLVPWNSGGLFVLSVLGVSPLSYGPYAVICWLTPIIIAIYGYFDITMHKLDKVEEYS